MTENDITGLSLNVEIIQRLPVCCPILSEVAYGQKNLDPKETLSQLTSHPDLSRLTLGK